MCLYCSSWSSTEETFFHPCSSTSRRRSSNFSTLREGFSDKSIIEGLEAGSLTHQFLLLPMGAFTSKGGEADGEAEIIRWKWKLGVLLSCYIRSSFMG
ncbi:hypothetical protein Lalb_Chr00c39g0409081 (mitochondrion) [Lupinus albus]|uniref:Uncharacterized protein n=1 Tax=Lupinus albus TaxID=3870 RepID=A0A6A4MIC9_LUPAL|nr:hypothetical protein Lalb_Chr00c39g0409081 [Lupinus albus]